jgi:DNA-binding protein Fis
LLSTGSDIAEPAIRLPDGQPMAARASSDPVAQTASRAAQAASAAMSAVNADASRGFVGLTVAEVEQHLIIDTLNHCFGNRTHAATILGISIRTLRNKLKEYSEAGVAVPAHQGTGTSAA